MINEIVADRVNRGVDFDDPDIGVKEEDKDFEKVERP